MTKTVGLNIMNRENADKAHNKMLKKDGYLLGVISIKGDQSVAVAVKKIDFNKTVKQNGMNAVIKLETDDNSSYNVMIKEIQVSPKDYEYSHVSFQQVSLTEATSAEVVITFIGLDLLESKNLLLNKQMEYITVTGLPQEIPETLEVNVSDLEAGDSVCVKDIKLPESITVELDLDHVIATIGLPKVQVEEVETEEVAKEETEEVV